MTVFMSISNIFLLPSLFTKSWSNEKNNILNLFQNFQCIENILFIIQWLLLKVEVNFRRPFELIKYGGNYKSPNQMGEILQLSVHSGW